MLYNIQMWNIPEIKKKSYQISKHLKSKKVPNT